MRRKWHCSTFGPKREVKARTPWAWSLEEECFSLSLYICLLPPSLPLSLNEELRVRSRTGRGLRPFCRWNQQEQERATALSPRPCEDREPGWQPMSWRPLAFWNMSFDLGGQKKPSEKFYLETRPSDLLIFNTSSLLLLRTFGLVHELGVLRFLWFSFPGMKKNHLAAIEMIYGWV